MAFPRNLLNDNEELILDLRPHWFFLAKAALLLFGAVVVAIVVLVADVDGGLGSALTLLSVVGVLGGLGYFGWKYLVWISTMFVLTSDRIVARNGVLSKQGVEIPLERINTVFFKQSLFERMLGSGDLALESAGERGNQSFTNIRKPSIVQKEIYVQMERNENRKFDRIHQGPPGGGVSADATTVQGGSSIPEQIEQLSELHQRGVLSDSEFQRKKAELLERM